MLIKNRKHLENLIRALIKLIKDKKVELFELNRKITLDTNYWISEDYETVMSYLENYIKNNYSIKLINNIKPKGKILVILSYNEPFILSIIPILNALVVGNEVVLKPSRRNETFINMIWQESGLAEKYGLKLNIISPKTHRETIGFIKKVQAVYFFGSYHTARSIAKICGEHYVGFYPEIETADSKIFNKDLSDIRKDAILTLKESFSHSGQSCQRIQGVFVNKNIYKDYVKVIKREFIKLCESDGVSKLIDNNYASTRKELLNSLLIDIGKAKPAEIINVKPLPLLVIKPQLKSEFIKNAYFLPVLWIYPFDTEEKLIKILNSRNFFLGLNIQSNDSKFIDHVINNTKFSRYTINTSHTNIRSQEGWGGSWPSGSSGYRSWIDHFSNPYIVIK